MTTETFSNFRFGLISREMITDTNISKNAKLVYATLRAAQGGLDYINTTQKEISTAIGISERSVKSACKELKDLQLMSLKDNKKSHYNILKTVVSEGNSGFGYIELAFLTSKILTPNEKLLYIFYTAVYNSAEDCSKWSRDRILKALKLTQRTFYPIIDSLTSKGIIRLEKGKAYKGINATQRAKIARAENFEFEANDFFKLPETAMSEEFANFKFPILRTIPDSQVVEEGKNDELTGKNCKVRINEDTPNKKINKKLNCLTRETSSQGLLKSEPQQVMDYMNKLTSNHYSLSIADKKMVESYLYSSESFENSALTNAMNRIDICYKSWSNGSMIKKFALSYCFSDYNLINV